MENPTGEISAILTDNGSNMVAEFCGHFPGSSKVEKLKREMKVKREKREMSICKVRVVKMRAALGTICLTLMQKRLSMK